MNTIDWTVLFTSLGTLLGAIVTGLFAHLKVKSDNSMRETESTLRIQNDLIKELTSQTSAQTIQLSEQAHQLAEQQDLIKLLYQKVDELEQIIIEHNIPYKK